jgi:hypothetical protein
MCRVPVSRKTPSTSGTPNVRSAFGLQLLVYSDSHAYSQPANAPASTAVTTIVNGAAMLRSISAILLSISFILGQNRLAFGGCLSFGFLALHCSHCNNDPRTIANSQTAPYAATPAYVATLYGTGAPWPARNRNACHRAPRIALPKSGPATRQRICFCLVSNSTFLTHRICICLVSDNSFPFPRLVR